MDWNPNPLCRCIFSAPHLRQRNLSQPLTLKASARKSHKIQSQAKPTKVLNSHSSVYITSRPATSQYPKETKTKPHSPSSHLRRLLLFPSKELPNFPAPEVGQEISQPTHFPLLPKTTPAFSGVQNLSTSIQLSDLRILLFNPFSCLYFTEQIE